MAGLREVRRQLAHLIRLVAELHRDEDEECAVCQNRPTTVEFNCLHRLCAGCAREIFAYFGTCPFCREPILSLVRYVTHGPSELLQRPASPVPDAVQNPPFEDEFRVSIAISAEADARLAEYQAKLRKIEDEVERVRREFREQGERDRARIVKEAEERRAALRAERRSRRR